MELLQKMPEIDRQIVRTRNLVLYLLDDTVVVDDLLLLQTVHSVFVFMSHSGHYMRLILF